MPGEGRRPRARAKLTDPVLWADATQLVKTMAAAVIAWVVATSVLDLPQSFLAPWSALLVVHATVYRTFSEGAKQVGGAVLGVLVAWGVGHTLGVDVLAVAVALAVGLVLGSVAWFEGQATTIAATALLVLTMGFSDNDNVLVSRLLDTGVGIAVGLVVNLAVWPPLRRRTAIAALDAIDDRIGELLVDLGDGLDSGLTRADLDGWVSRTRDLDAELDRAWALVRQARESARMNPRRSAGQFRDPREWVSLLQRMDQALADLRSMVRTMSHALDHQQVWQQEFRGLLVEILREGGTAIVRAEREPLASCRARLDELVGLVDLGGPESPASPQWPVYGGLVINLRNIFDAMDEVAAANPMRQPPLPIHGRGTQSRGQ